MIINVNENIYLISVNVNTIFYLYIMFQKGNVIFGIILDEEIVTFTVIKAYYKKGVVLWQRKKEKI